MDKNEIIKMELSEWFNLDFTIQNTLDEGYEEVSSAIHSTYRGMTKAVNIDKDLFEKYKELASDPDLEKNIKLVILQSLRDHLDAKFTELAGK
jgi:hypothetical protein